MSTTVTLAPPVARLDTVLGTFGMAIAMAIESAGIHGGTVFIGWPEPTDLETTLAAGRFLVSIFPLSNSLLSESRRIPGRWKRAGYKVTRPTITLTASKTNFSTLTFAGTAQGELNIHTFVSKPSVYDTVSGTYVPQADAYYRTTDADTLETIAANVADAINALNEPEVSARASGTSVTTFGGVILKCNIGGSGTKTEEVDRIERRVQVSVWAPSADSVRNPMLGLRTAVGDAIVSNVGTMADPFLPLGDGTSAWVKYHSEASKDSGQSSFKVYELHIIYTLEYGIIRNSVVTEVGAIVQTATLPGSKTLINIQG